jgi:Raf kinase inhibitor-like YbhB/YbcL family protein
MPENTLHVTSDAFQDGGTIPQRHAHSMVGGENVSPNLKWTGAPDRAQSFAVTCYDPDAPTTVGFVHWVLFNLDGSTTSLDEGAGASGKQPSGAVLGFSDWGESQYGGMAPPQGDEPHHYQFTVYALDLPKLELGETATYALFRFMIRGHVLATGTLTGRFGL